MVAKMMASAFLAEGKSVASFPMYGFERRGAPVVAFARVDDKPIMEKTQIYFPDCLVVIDPGLMTLPTLFNGLKPNGALIVNSKTSLKKKPNDNLVVGGVVNATQIAVEEIGRDIPNTCLLGAFAATTGWLKLESVLACLEDYLSGDMKSAERGYKEVEVIKW